MKEYCSFAKNQKKLFWKQIESHLKKDAIDEDRPKSFRRAALAAQSDIAKFLLVLVILVMYNIDLFAQQKAKPLPTDTVITEWKKQNGDTLKVQSCVTTPQKSGSWYTQYYISAPSGDTLGFYMYKDTTFHNIWAREIKLVPCNQYPPTTED